MTSEVRIVARPRPYPLTKVAWPTAVGLFVLMLISSHANGQAAPQSGVSVAANLTPMPSASAPPSGVAPAAFAQPAIVPTAPSAPVVAPPEPGPMVPIPSQPAPPGQTITAAPGPVLAPWGTVPLGAPPVVVAPWNSLVSDHPQDEYQNLQLFTDVDSWHGVADRSSFFGAATSNDGMSFGANYATRLGRLSELTGIGFQLGASYGVYDWNGRPFTFGTLNTTEAQQQTFVTLGFFKRADAYSRISYGFVHDWMINQGWGAFAVNPTLGQWRGQVAVAFDDRNEIGTWFTFYDQGSTKLDFFGNQVEMRAIDQTNLFWHHKWNFAADSWLWVGIPQSTRLNPFAGGSLGDWLIGGSVIAPLNEWASLYANAQYMHPSAAPSSIAAGEASWYVAFGVQFSLGGRARSDTVMGRRWMPLLPVANNGNFLVDQTRLF